MLGVNGPIPLTNPAPVPKSVNVGAIHAKFCISARNIRITVHSHVYLQDARGAPKQQAENLRRRWHLRRESGGPRLAGAADRKPPPRPHTMAPGRFLP